MSHELLPLVDRATLERTSFDIDVNVDDLITHTINYFNLCPDTSIDREDDSFVLTGTAISEFIFVKFQICFFRSATNQTVTVEYRRLSGDHFLSKSLYDDFYNTMTSALPLQCVHDQRQRLENLKQLCNIIKSLDDATCVLRYIASHPNSRNMIQSALHDDAEPTDMYFEQLVMGMYLVNMLKPFVVFHVPMPYEVISKFKDSQWSLLGRRMFKM